MYKIQTLNKISDAGIDRFPRDKYEMASEILNPDAVLLRSYTMHGMKLPKTVKAVARAGAGVNNIPVKEYTENGVVVFNTPGANANAVKELVLTGLFISSRKIYRGIEWAKTLVDRGDEVPKIVETGKSQFAGPEIKGKKLGVIGLGAIGVMVANNAVDLGMEVMGFDPYISIEAAWGLSRSVTRASGLDRLIAMCDYITIHVPLNDNTKGMMNYEKFSLMKKGVRLLNFSRGGLVNNRDCLKAIDAGIISSYITDFPDEELLKNDVVICLPHLGASTKESENNCAIMASDQICDFLENGNITNSVNFPHCRVERTPRTNRLIIANTNIPNMVGQITAVLAEYKMNIAELVNKHRNEIAYNIIDIDGGIIDNAVEKINDIEGVFMVRVLSS